MRLIPRHDGRYKDPRIGDTVAHVFLDLSDCMSAGKCGMSEAASDSSDPHLGPVLLLTNETGRYPYTGPVSGLCLSL